MDSNPEEVMGCFLGMAVGDAMGRAVKGLKPEAIRQIFGTIADYKDVRNIIGTVSYTHLTLPTILLV